MDSPYLTYVLLVVNLAFAVGGGVLLAGDMMRLRGGRMWKWLFALGGIYMAECVAFSASMATNMWSWALAVAWGFLFARWLRSAEVTPQARERLVMRLATYTCLPAVSFLSVFVLMAISGWPVFTPEGGYKFGIPQIIPWPLCTVAGFFAAVVGSAVVGKTAITMFIALWRKGKSRQP